MAQPPRLPATRHSFGPGDVREGAGEGRSATPDDPERCPSNQQTTGILPKPVFDVPIGTRAAWAQEALRLRDGISARSATTATSAPARAMAVGILVAGATPATASAAVTNWAATGRTASVCNPRMSRP